MKNILRAWLIIFISFVFLNQLSAEEYHRENTKQGNNLKQTTAGCSPASAYDWLDINNVKARINTGGDMWWDLPGGVGAKYFIPKEGSATSMFSGSLWIGGLDINNQFALYYPEKRPFFLEGNDQYGFAGSDDMDPFRSIVHTRSIVDPEIGAKITGKIGST